MGTTLPIFELNSYCNHLTDRNLYPIATKFGTQVRLVNVQTKFEDELYGPHRSRNTLLQSFKILMKS